MEEMKNFKILQMENDFDRILKNNEKLLKEKYEKLILELKEV